MRIKRRLFFFVEKLDITPSERRLIVPLLTILMILGILNLSISNSAPFDSEYYRELDQQFSERRALIKKKEQQVLERYYPDEKNLVPVMAVDTVAEDSLKKSTETKENRININKASADQLTSLPGIGPTYARRIIEYRKKNGGFKTVEELKKIKGIAEKRLDNLKPFIKLKGSD